MTFDNIPDARSRVELQAKVRLLKQAARDADRMRQHARARAHRREIAFILRTWRPATAPNGR